MVKFSGNEAKYFTHRIGNVLTRNGTLRMPCKKSSKNRTFVSILIGPLYRFLQGYRNIRASSVISSQMLLTGFPIEISVLSKL
jgi:hypothetical protein